MGSLIGYDLNWNEVDFREQAGIYLLFDGADLQDLRLIYVGQTGRGKGHRLYARLNSHRNNHLWNRWKWFSWFGIYRVGKEGALVHRDRKNIHLTTAEGLDQIEAVLLTVSEPPLNKQGPRWGGAQAYFQNPAEEPTTLQSRLDEIESRLDEMVRVLGEDQA